MPAVDNLIHYIIIEHPFYFKIIAMFLIFLVSAYILRKFFDEKRKSPPPLGCTIVLTLLFLVIFGYIFNTIKSAFGEKSQILFLDAIYTPIISIVTSLLASILVITYQKKGIDGSNSDKKEKNISITNPEIKIDIPAISIQLKSKDISLSEECINENAEKSEIQQPTEQKSIEPQPEPAKTPEKEQAESQSPK